MNSLSLPQQSIHSASSTHSHGLSLKSVAQKVVKAAKEHNKNVNSAFEQYYGLNYRPAKSVQH
jgi:hypothetical protein